MAKALNDHRIVLMLDQPEPVIQWALGKALARDEAALKFIRNKRLYRGAFFIGVSYQNGVRHPRDRALEYYALTLYDPNRKTPWRAYIADAMTLFEQGRTTFDQPYETSDQISARYAQRTAEWKAKRRRGLQRAVGQTGLATLEPRAPTAGEAFVALVGAMVAKSVSDVLSGKAELNDPTAGNPVYTQDHMGEFAKDLATSLWL